jgi:hypothetical protein
MATQSVEFRAVTGQTITAKLFAAGSDTEVASVTATEGTNRKGTYTAAFTDVAAGEYQLLAFNATPIPVASWLVTLTLTTATFQVYDRVDKDGITRSNWAALTVDHTSTGSFGYVVGLFFQLIENVTGWRFTTKALEQAPGGSASGSGARTVTVTVNDGTTALQNARVRMTEGANSYSALTNASGVATFNLDDATYTVAITKAGYSYAGTTLVVDGNETITYSMTLVTITASNSPFVTGYYTCYSELGVVESGVTITLQVHKVPSETGLALDSAVRTATSDSNGLAQFTNLVPGTTYLIKRGSGADYTVKIADNATGSVELNSILGT